MNAYDRYFYQWYHPSFMVNILKPGPPLQTLALFLQLRIEAPQATIGLFQLG